MAPTAPLPACPPRPQVVDALFLQYTLQRTLVKGVSVHLLFAFEFAIQASTIVMTFVKYVL